MPIGINSLVNIGNGLAANDGTGDDLRDGATKINNNSAAIVEAINNLAASQSAGRISYLTKAAMDADVAHADGTLADVTNDTTDANNQTYRKTGASGSGSWVATVDRIAQTKADLASTAPGKGAALLGYLSGTVKSFLDSLAQTGASVGSALLGFIHSGTGAVARTAQNKMRDTINVLDYGAVGDGVTDDAASIQKALNAAAGKTLVFAPLTFKVGTALLVNSGTTIHAYGATFYRVGALDNLIRNKADGVTGGSSANSNIRIYGGTWDSVNGSGSPTGNCTVMAFGHSSNVIVRDAIFFNENDWHHIEINGSKGITIDNCEFNGGYNTAKITNEAIQIDSPANSSQFPWFGPYDNTPCQTIRVHNCRFYNIGCGPGSHSPVQPNHNNIIVSNCYFENVYYACVKAYHWSDVKVIGNKGQSCAFGFIGQLQSVGLGNDYTIMGNTFVSIGYGAYPFDSRGIQFEGVSDFSKNYINVNVSNNKVLSVNGANGTHGISLNYVATGAVANNVVDSCTRAGIYIFGGNGVTVSGNAAHNCGTGSYADIMIGDGDINNGTRFNVSGNFCGNLITNGMRFSMVRNNNIFNSATHTGNSGSNTLDNLVVATFTAG